MAVSNVTNTPSTTYILQVSSNLNCDSLEIELTSQTNGKSNLLKFNSNAFSEVALTEGVYIFGGVFCQMEGEIETFEILEGKIAPINLKADAAYYGGLLIFQESEVINTHDVPDVLTQCSDMRSAARSDQHRDSTSGNECRDGTGVNTSAPITRQIEAFAPIASDRELEAVRKALEKNTEQLLYIPLKV